MFIVKFSTHWRQWTHSSDLYNYVEESDKHRCVLCSRIIQRWWVVKETFSIGLAINSRIHNYHWYCRISWRLQLDAIYEWFNLYPIINPPIVIHFVFSSEAFLSAMLFQAEIIAWLKDYLQVIFPISEWFEDRYIK